MIIVWLAVFPAGPRAQQGLTLGADAIFYGDNTEFANPFREGETIFGVTARLGGNVEITDAVTLSLGVFGNQRFGSDDAFELVRPVIALTVTGARSRLIFGTLDTPRAGSPAGPDRTGPHGLLPPIQRETLAFERPYEAGLQWTYTGGTLDHDAWLQWQRLNTPDHRERLDAGVRAAWAVTRHVAIPFQTHIVHEGGQLFDTGPVRDSFALASGMVLSNGSPSSASGKDGGQATLAGLELYGLWSRYTPNREAPRPTRAGGAFLGRFSVERQGWRAHLIVWRGDDYIKDEGDPNYLSIRGDGTIYRGIRDYAETGLTRTFRLAPAALLETSFRFHRIERDYEYSYRVLGVVRAKARIR